MKTDVQYENKLGDMKVSRGGGEKWRKTDRKERARTTNTEYTEFK